MAKRLTKLEKETLINFNDGEPNATIYTCNRHMIRRVKEIKEHYPDLVEITNETENSISATFPRGWVKLSMPRVVSKENRAKAADRMRKNRYIR